MIVYKLFKKRKDGSFGPLFINRKQKIKFNEWLEAENHPTKGYTERPGWHTTKEPKADHLSVKNRVWCKVEIEDYYIFERPKYQGGVWYIANKMRVLEEV